jgi:hypothetical protein
MGRPVAKRFRRVFGCQQDNVPITIDQVATWRLHRLY